MSARSVCRSQEDVVGGAGVDLQEAKMSLPRLVNMQTANIPPEERTRFIHPIPCIICDIHLPVAIHNN